MIYDINTSNKSFIEMSNYLQEQGVDNNKFMLTLYDESLVGVDPHREDLDPITQGKIFVEITRNFWYYLREVVLLPVPGSINGTKFELNLGNMAAAYCCINNINHILVLPRQLGKTVIEILFSIWVNLFSGLNTEERYFHQNKAYSKDNLYKARMYINMLPEWLKKLCINADDINNSTCKRNSRLKNTITAMPSANNDISADKLCRGISSPLVHYDDFAFIEKNEIIWTAMLPAWRVAADVAKKNGSYYGIRITTTPNTLNLAQANFCWNLINESCKFTFEIYDISLNELEDYVYKKSNNNFLYIYYSWKEMGKTQEWYDTLSRVLDHFHCARELDCLWPCDEVDAQLPELENLKK